MNQTQNGGEWQLLGTFTLDPALNPKVVLSDQANGTVMADAVMVVPSGTSGDRVTYTPTFASAATVDIYAKWTENANRADQVTYRIHHAGGSSDIVVNQQQPSGEWYHLGAFAMAPGQNHRVEINGALEGITVADAVRFVSSGVSAPGISYVHADHLGSPQKMTDASKAIVWDAVFTPFGQVHSITGTVTNNQRFPGQYADAETGYHQNWFRDYDPSTGRYLQSDPIGLVGGMNMYAYAEGTPIKNIDPRGLFSLSGFIGCAKGYAKQANSRLSSDGEKHCWVSCKIASSCGLGTWGSAIVGVGKELQDLFDFDSGTHAEFRDLLNDAKGNLCGSSGTKQCQGCGKPLDVRPGQCDTCCGCLANQSKLS